MRQNLNTTAKIDAALAATNGRAQSFTVTSADTLRVFATAAEEQLAGILPKSAWPGARVTCCPQGPSSSYSYSAQTTKCVLERGAKDWFLISCERDQVFPKAPRMCRVTLTAAQTLAVPLVAEKRLAAAFTLTPVAQDASAHERLELHAAAQKLAGVA
ncbi:hypothetical protein [Henriciella pelagia]|uniref:hypothetical protein n=1 Tax=Henriciella pelagia TaxID=1977912 RepID=UPI0035141EB1